MTRKIAMMISAGLAVLVLAAGCAPAVKAPPAPLGKFESRPIDQAVIRLYLTADGTMIRAEGKRGGNWEKEIVFNGKPKSLGKPLADIRMWEHDGTEADVTKDDGTSAHPHSGPTNPPWGSHCHRFFRIDGQYVGVHCP